MNLIEEKKKKTVHKFDSTILMGNWSEVFF